MCPVWGSSPHDTPLVPRIPEGSPLDSVLSTKTPEWREEELHLEELRPRRLEAASAHRCVGKGVGNGNLPRSQEGRVGQVWGAGSLASSRHPQPLRASVCTAPLPGALSRDPVVLSCTNRPVVPQLLCPAQVNSPDPLGAPRNALPGPGTGLWRRQSQPSRGPHPLCGSRPQGQAEGHGTHGSPWQPIPPAHPWGAHGPTVPEHTDATRPGWAAEGSPSGSPQASLPTPLGLASPHHLPGGAL